MKLPWSRAASSANPSAGMTSALEEEQKCPGLAKVLDKILRDGKAEILDLGAFCGASAVYLANRGARVSVAEFVPPPAVPEPEASGPRGKSLKPAAPVEPPPPIRLGQPDGKFDLVLVWELCDFVPKQRLSELGAELHRVLVPGGWAMLFSISDLPAEGHAARRPPRYRLIRDDLVVREPNEGPPLKRYAHNPRDIERALAPLSVQGIQLQRNQLREFTLFKR